MYETTYPPSAETIVPQRPVVEVSINPELAAYGLVKNVQEKKSKTQESSIKQYKAS